MSRDRIKGHLELLLLSVLRAGPAHGYEVIAAMKRRSDGELDVPEGTVYPALHKLEEGGLLASEWDTGAARRRRVYRLTPRGESALATERSAWRRFSAGVEAVIAS
ncbi:MAG TPA: helix-turn-helix transcriptional regulator [Streptosporangiaceae bacterium]|jgi:DNA-binding PadR family transcriptional regulator